MSLLRKLLPLLLITTLISGSATEIDKALPEVELGTSGYVEWQSGDAPIIISIPHGGSLRPKELPNRNYGKTARDGRTLEIGEELRTAIFKATGKKPHLIACHLHRSKLDANRELKEAAQGAAKTELAWSEYHGFIERARSQVTDKFKAGLYIDLHGQSHPEGWIEWGYTVSGKALAEPDTEQVSSLDHLVRTSVLSLQELISGPTSLGARAQALGYASVPSPRHPHPHGGQYFSGGYSTRRHGSRAGGTIDGVQLELPRALRVDEPNREKLCRDLATVVIGFMKAHYELNWIESE